jgi:hypothetical protein
MASVHCRLRVKLTSVPIQCSSYGIFVCSAQRFSQNSTEGMVHFSRGYSFQSGHVNGHSQFPHLQARLIKSPCLAERCGWHDSQQSTSDLVRYLHIVSDQTPTCRSRNGGFCQCPVCMFCLFSFALATCYVQSTVELVSCYKLIGTGGQRGGRPQGGNRPGRQSTINIPGYAPLDGQQKVHRLSMIWRSCFELSSSSFATACHIG